MWVALVRVFGGMLLTFAGSILGRVLLALGLSFVTYSGMNVGIDFLKSEIQTNLSGMPSDIVNFLAWLWVDRAFSMVFSTYTVSMTFKLAGSTVLKKLVRK